MVFQARSLDVLEPPVSRCRVDSLVYYPPSGAWVDEHQFADMMARVTPYLTPPEQSVYLRLF